jgi:hypothetical protein
MNTTFPPTPVPRVALHCRPASAARSSASRNPAYAPRKGVTTVQPLRGFRFIDSLPPRGGPSEATS